MSLTKPSYVPKCPNHSVALEGCGFPIPAKGKGKCPISGADFEFQADINEEKISLDKDGNAIKTSDWKVEGHEEV